MSAIVLAVTSCVVVIVLPLPERLIVLPLPANIIEPTASDLIFSLVTDLTDISSPEINASFLIAVSPIFSVAIVVKDLPDVNVILPTDVMKWSPPTVVPKLPPIFKSKSLLCALSSVPILPLTAPETLYA